jgi:hypothetical protein
MPFVRDQEHWLHKFSPEGWIRAAMADLRRAEDALKQKNSRAALAGCRRAAGMALNGALCLVPNPAWGRTYVEHIQALRADDSLPEAVRAAANTLMEAQPPGGPLVSLRTSRSDDRMIEATKDLIAHAYAVIIKNTDAQETP